MISNSDFIKKILFNGIKHTPTKGQLQLIDKLSSFVFCQDKHPLFVILGYAGTGKTSVVSSLVKALPYANMNSVLLAPTGRAAKVLAEYSGNKAYTIHKYIYFVNSSPERGFSIQIRPNKHKNTIFVVDEASMISDSDSNIYKNSNLLNDLINFVFQGNNCRLILCGDTAQLPPVGIEYSPALNIEFLKTSFNLSINQFELTDVVRQSEDSAILENATYLRQKIHINNSEPPFFIKNNNVDLIKITGAELEECLIDEYSKNGAENVAIICRSNKRAVMFNNEIRNRILFKEELITAGDLLMVVKNNYLFLPKESNAGFIANGDIIEIIRIKRLINLYDFNFAEATVKLLDYPEEKDFEVVLLTDTLNANTAALEQSDYIKLYNSVSIDYADIPQKSERIKKIRENVYLNALQIKYSYALTCHKTQGGQWDTVFVEQGYINKDMINTEYLRWLYTAVTRAKQKLYLVNFKDDLFA